MNKKQIFFKIASLKGQGKTKFERCVNSHYNLEMIEYKKSGCFVYAGLEGTLEDIANFVTEENTNIIYMSEDFFDVWHR